MKILFPLFLALAGCSATRIQKVSAERFAELAQVKGSAHYGMFVGAPHERAYLEYWQIAPSSKKGSHTVFWAPVAEFPPQVQDLLRAGENPWPRPRPEAR